jgi:hypothetical protein
MAEKTKKTTTVYITSLSKYTSPEIKEIRNKDWVEYGKDNNYFQYLIDRFTGSTTNNAIINGIVKMIYGKGLSATDASRKTEAYAQALSMFKKKDLRRFITDRKMLGMSSFQINYKSKKIDSVSHFPMNTLRPEKMNDKGQIEAWYYHPDWAHKKANEEPERIASFGFGNKSENEIYVLKPYVAGYDYFSPVDYVGCLPYAVLEEEVGDYLINDVRNGFSGTKIINFNNGVPDEEKMKAITNDVNKKTTGANGLKTIVSFNNNAESKTTIDDVPLNDAPNHYQYLSDECRNKLIVGHRVTSPMLLGVRETGGGLGNNADEIKTANLLFDNVVINTFQGEITDALDEILLVNDISLNLYFKTIEPLEFIDTAGMDKATREQETGVKMSSEVDLLDTLGEVQDESWELIDEREVDYEMESELDEEIELKNNPPKSILSQIWNLVSTGTANPNASSEQDATINESRYFVRYEYAGSASPERPFCQKMMSAGKLYRKEDIDRMSASVVNAGWGPEGADTYDVFLYKGGGDCHHKWVRKTFKTDGKVDVNNPNAPTISTNKSDKEGYRVRNPKEVSMMPKDMPYNGFLPTNKRFQ